MEVSRTSSSVIVHWETYSKPHGFYKCTCTRILDHEDNLRTAFYQNMCSAILKSAYTVYWYTLTNVPFSSRANRISSYKQVWLSSRCHDRCRHLHHRFCPSNVFTECKHTDPHIWHLGRLVHLIKIYLYLLMCCVWIVIDLWRIIEVIIIRVQER